MRSFVPLRPGSRFAAIYRSGHRRRCGGITVLQFSSDGSRPQVGVVAGRNVGNAVHRNRAKRRLREATDTVALASNTAYVVVASREVLDVSFGDLVQWISTAVGSVATSEGERS